MHLAKELIRNVQYSGCSRNFAKEIRALEMRSSVASYQKLTNDQLRGSLKPNLLKLHKKLLKSSALAILWSFSIWSKLERWKNFINGCLVSWPKIKIVVLKCCLPLFYAKTNHFSIGLWCATKSGFYLTNTGDGQLSVWTGKKIQSISQCQTYTKKKKKKKVMITVWLSAAHPIHDSFLNPGETITSEKYPQQIDEMHRKLAVLAAGSIEWALFFSVTTLDLMSNSQHFKTWTNWAVKFCLICWIHQTSSLIHLTSWQITTTSSSILTTFCREEASTTSRIQKMLSKSSLNPIAWVFMLQE